MAISLYFAGVSRYPLVEVRVVVDRVGSAKAGSQPRLRLFGLGIVEAREGVDEFCNRSCGIAMFDSWL